MGKFSDLLPRLLVASVLIVLLGFFLYLGGLAFAVLLYFVLLILFYELYRLLAFKFRFTSFLAGVLALTVSFWTGNVVLTILLLVLFGLFNYILGFSIKEAFVLMAAIVFLLVPAYIAIRLREESLLKLLYVLVCNWSSDTFAYFSGKLFGRRRIFPQISRGKTLEGHVGGILGSSLVGGILGYFFGYDIPIATLIGAYIGFFAQIGDLVESALKREKGVKDSGKLLPGHGGLMDRVDSLLLSLTAFWMVKGMI